CRRAPLARSRIQVGVTAEGIDSARGPDSAWCRDRAPAPLLTSRALREPPEAGCRARRVSEAGVGLRGSCHLLAPLADAVDERVELFEVDGFDEVEVEAGGRAASAVRGLAV